MASYYQQPSPQQQHQQPLYPHPHMHASGLPYQSPQVNQAPYGSAPPSHLPPPPTGASSAAAGSYYAYQAPPQSSAPAAAAQPHIPSIHQHHLQQKQQQQQMMPPSQAQSQQYHSAPQPSYYQQPPHSYGAPPLPPQQQPAVFLTPPHHPHAQPVYMSPPHHTLGPPQAQPQLQQPVHFLQQFNSSPHMQPPHIQAQMQSQRSPPHLSGAHTPQPPHHHPGSVLSTSTSTPMLSAQKPAPSPVQHQAPQPVTPAPANAVVPSLATVFSDLDSRFLVNLPDEELSSFERIMFQLQQAHWFYLDWYSDRFQSLPKLSYKAFCTMYFKHIPSFRAHLSKFEQVYNSFNLYLNAVPVCGCILINPEKTHCVMVRSYVGNSWGFPRGKLDANEDEITCAIREIDEEIGFDCRQWFKGYEITPAGALTRQTSSESNTSTTSSSSALLHSQPSYIEAQSSTKVIRLYILQNVPNSTKFVTKTRKEIGEIGWIPLAALPSKGSNTNGGFTFTNMMQLFAPKLRTFVKKLKAGEITGYGLYEQRQPQHIQSPPQPQMQQQQQATPEPTSGKKSKQSDNQKSGKKNKDQVQAQQQQQQASHRRDSVKQGQKPEDARNAQTFSSISNQNGGGWSPEQMFAANAKLGVVSTVEEAKIQLPAHLDAQLDAALGRKAAGSAAKGKNTKKNASVPDGVSHTVSDPVAIPNANLKSASKPTQELDYGHNAYVNFSNLSLHLQPNTSSPPNAKAPVPMSTTAAVLAPAIAELAQNQTPADPKKRRQPKGDKQKQSLPAPADAASTATATPAKQIRIQKRPTSAASAPAAAPTVASSAPAASSVPASTEFKFDLDSILEPMSS
jgi:mRNA-decapping enzyme subunit 2